MKALLLPATLILALACGGGGASTSTATPPQASATPSVAAPAGLTYATPAPACTVGIALTPDLPASTGGAVASYSVAPALPAGLALDPATGILSGTPTAATAAAAYVVTALNAGGQTSATLTIVVSAPAPPPTANNLSVVIDDTFTDSEKTWIQTFTNQLAYVLNDMTGETPVASFNLTYDPSYHKSWNNDLTVLQASTKQEADAYWASWYTVEVAHKYVPQYTDFTTASDITLFRTNEYNAQALSACVCYAMAGTAFSSNFTQQETAAHAETIGILQDPGFAAAYDSLKPEVIESAYPDNYNGMDDVGCDEAMITYGALFQADPLFWKKFFALWSQTNWVGRAGYQQLVASAVGPATIYGVPTAQWLAGRPQFAAQPASVPLAIDIALLGPTRNRAYIRHDLSTLNPHGFVIIGASSIPTDSLPDPLLFGQQAALSITDEATQAVVWTGTATIVTNLDNPFTPLPALPPGSYVMQASIPVYGQTLTDAVSFTQ